MQMISFLVSCLLHLGLILATLITFARSPAEFPRDLTRHVYEVELTHFARLDPEKEPVPEPDPEPGAAPPPPEEQVVRIPEPDSKPEPRREPDPVPDPDPEPEPEPDPKPDPEPDPEPDPKPDPEPDPEPEAKPDHGPTPEEIRQQALAAIQREVEEFRRDRPAREHAGVVDIYRAIAAEHIKRNWRYPRIGRDDNLVVRVQVEIDAGGRILDYRIVQGSGREEFDHSALRAIEDTARLPDPPPRVSTLVIDFNLKDLL